MPIPWYDPEMRGRRLEAIVKHMNTKFWNNIDTNPDLAFSFLDRILKIENVLTPYVEEINQTKKFLKESKKRMTLKDGENASKVYVS